MTDCNCANPTFLERGPCHVQCDVRARNRTLWSAVLNMAEAGWKGSDIREALDIPRSWSVGELVFHAIYGLSLQGQFAQTRPRLHRFGLCHWKTCPQCQDNSRDMGIAN